MSKGWTEERDLLLIQLIGEGFSCSRVAERLNQNHSIIVSKNAVIGRCVRLRAVGKMPPFAPRMPGRAAVRKSRAKPDRRHPWRRPTVQVPSLPAEPLPDRVADSREPSDGCRLIDLGPLPPNAEKCRWPLGPVMAKAEFFCGRSLRDPSAVYCDQHAAEAFCSPSRRY